MAWFKKDKQPKAPVTGEARTVIPEGLWVKCFSCKEIIYRQEVAARANVCPKCNYHFRISARERLTTLFDNGIYEELDTGLRAKDPLHFVDTKPYKDRLKQYQAKTGLDDAVINAAGRMGGYPVVIAAMVVFAQLALGINGTAKLASPYYQRVIEHAALLEIFD